MATINIRVDDALKNKTENILSELGLNMTTALTLYLKAIVRIKGIPFSIELPNNETLEAFDEVEKISKGKSKAKKYSSVSEIRKDLGL